MQVELSDAAIDSVVIETLKQVRENALRDARRPIDTADNLDVVAAVDVLLAYFMTSEEHQRWRFALDG